MNLLSYHLYFKPHLSHLGFEYCARRFADSFCRDIKTKNDFDLMGVLKDGFCFKRRLRTVNFHGKESLSPVNKRLSVEAAGSGGGEVGGGGKVDVASSCRVQMHFSTFLDTGE